MKKNITGIGLLILLPFLIQAADQKTWSLSLEECIAGAVRNNLDVAVEVINPRMADLTVSLANEKFMPTLAFNFDNTKTNTASYSWIDIADQVRTSSQDYSFSLRQMIPTGGRFDISLDSYKNDTNRGFQTINPRYGSTMSFNFTQPLLKNFGFKISRKEVLIARNNRDASEQLFKQALMEIIYNVEDAYWNLAYSIESLEVKRQSLELAKDLLEENKRKVEVGTLAPIEIYTAEAEVATREADILQAEALVKNSADRLRTLINMPDIDDAALIEIIPVDKPAFSEVEVSLDEALDTALLNRPDLKARGIDLESRELDMSYSKNQLLPELNLYASYWSPGVSGDRILYLDDNPFSGVIVGREPGGASDALRDALNFKYRNWSVGVTLTIPLNSIFSRAQVAQARLNLELSRLRMKNQKKQIMLEIKTAVRAVQTDYKRVQAYRAARELAEKKLEAEQEKFKVGKSTNYTLLQYQRDAADARSAELKALVDYTLSQAFLDKALGTTFRSKNIRFADIMERP